MAYINLLFSCSETCNSQYTERIPVRHEKAHFDIFLYDVPSFHVLEMYSASLIAALFASLSLANSISDTQVRSALINRAGPSAHTWPWVIPFLQATGRMINTLGLDRTHANVPWAPTSFNWIKILTLSTSITLVIRFNSRPALGTW